MPVLLLHAVLRVCYGAERRHEITIAATPPPSMGRVLDDSGTYRIKLNNHKQWQRVLVEYFHHHLAHDNPRVVRPSLEMFNFDLRCPITGEEKNLNAFSLIALSAANATTESQVRNNGCSVCTASHGAYRGLRWSGLGD